MIDTPNDIQTMEMDAKLSEEFLKPKLMNSNIDRYSVLGL
jgi:hypothetical protein